MGEKVTTILLTGPPGVGKTTLVRKICMELMERYNCQGFLTEEVRVGGTGARVGFDVVTLQGKRGILARETVNDGLQRPKVGKYSVYVNDFETLVLPLLSENCEKPTLLVIDEIGKMELISKRFESAVQALIEQMPILATVPYQNRQSIPLVSRLKNSNRSKLFEITKTNRNEISQIILQYITKMFDK